MKNFAILAMLITGLMFSSCEKENKVAEEMPPISNFEEFQAWAGDRLVFSEEDSNDEFDCYLYFAKGINEPIVIAQPKKSFDKKPPLEIKCYEELSWIHNILYCGGEGEDCNRGGSGTLEICNYAVLVEPEYR